VLSRLDAARSSLGLGSYLVPPGFLALTADRQLLILADLDRSAYGYSPLLGLNAQLSSAAQAGVRERDDPRAPSAEGPWEGFGSDWADAGALISYYLWMYDDGWQGPNSDCTSPHASGCWGHRRVILGEDLSVPQPQLLGAASGQSSSGHAGSALIVSAHPGASTYYTWAQAQAEGAGGATGGEGGAVGEHGTEGGSGSESGGGGGGTEQPVCTQISGSGAVSSAGDQTLAVSDRLSTSLSHAQVLEGWVRVTALKRFRLTGLSAASCAAIPGGRELRGSGTASFGSSAGYAISFAFAEKASGTTLSLELSLGPSLVYSVSDVELTPVSGERIS
jgi:hypothetical protein